MGQSGDGNVKLPETIRAAFMIARRDFTATVLSKTFLLFLLRPLFPIALGWGWSASAPRSTAMPKRRR
jgi:ABC-2 type transport system permease protein